MTNLSSPMDFRYSSKEMSSDTRTGAASGHALRMVA
jgi:hypothetical protein